MSRDEVCFQSEMIEDYTLEDLFKVNKAHLIDIRVKLLLKEELILYPGEDIFAKTACVVSGHDRDFSMHILPADFSMYILPNNNVPLRVVCEVPRQQQLLAFTLWAAKSFRFPSLSGK